MLGSFLCLLKEEQMKNKNVINIARKFNVIGEIVDVEEYGSGNVNDTYLVTIKATHESSFILQKINTKVFGKPEQIVHNMRLVTEHIKQKMEKIRFDSRWEIPKLIPCNTHDYLIDEEGFFWRALSYISNSKVYDVVESTVHAKEAGFVLGMFQMLISDMKVENLYDTLPGFHITPNYLKDYDKVEVASKRDKVLDSFIEERRKFAFVLEKARQQGKLKLRPIHGDPKISNILMDKTTDRGISIIDLDTVKPGLIHYDIGDCLRSCCNSLGEEASSMSKIKFDISLCKAILEGYISVAKKFLTANDYLYIYDSVKLITFELGLRFYTDFLKGNVYFKVKDKEHNLRRARVQFRLVESIEEKEKEIKDIIACICKSYK